MELEFAGEIWFWRGPAPHHFITVPEDESEILRDEAAFVSYGWGMIPVTVRIGESEFETSLFPKDGGYIVPIKLAVRRTEGLTVGDVPAVQLRLRA